MKMMRLAILRIAFVELIIIAFVSAAPVAAALGQTKEKGGEEARLIEALLLKGALISYGPKGTVSVSLSDDADSKAVPWKGDDRDLELLPEVHGLTSLQLLIHIKRPSTLRFLSRIRDLRSLEIGGNSTNDEGAKYISECQHLECLRGVCAFTNVGMQHILRLKGLKSLELICPRVGDEGLNAIGDLSELSELDLVDSQITARTLSKIAKLSKLETLNLSATDIADDAIPELVKIRSIKTLMVRDTKISVAGLKRLRLSLPMCEVTGGGANLTGHH